MKIAGVQMNSFVDFPGKIAAVIFTQGCNMNCFYCHNRPLIPNGNQTCCSADDLLETLAQRKTFLDSVVISGGEPTLQPGLKDYITQLKALGFAVKLDTNGSNPQLLEELISKGLLDYVAMDIKAPYDKYMEICGTPVSLKQIDKSITLLMEGEIDFEFRTTYVPQLNEQDILSIAQRINGARRYILQQFRAPSFQENLADERIHAVPHTPAVLLNTINRLKNYHIQCQTRGA